jgi:hypothetical protein
MQPELPISPDSKPDGSCCLPPAKPEERQHRVDISSDYPGPATMSGTQTVIGGDEFVAAALRAFANKIDPPPPPVAKPPLHR